MVQHQPLEIYCCSEGGKSEELELQHETLQFPALAISYRLFICMSNTSFLQNKKAAIHVL